MSSRCPPSTTPSCPPTSATGPRSAASSTTPRSPSSASSSASSRSSSRKTAQPADGSQGSAATQTYRDMLPGAMADAVMAEGGLGLAQQIDSGHDPGGHQVSAALLPSAPAASGLGPALLSHLDDQLASTGRLLQIVLAQATAIRDRDVDTVLSAITEIQGEMDRRAGLERVRAQILTHAGAQLGVQAHVVTLDAICSLIAPTDAHRRPRAQRAAARHARRGRPPAPGQPHPHAPGALLPRAPHPPARRRGARRLRALRGRGAPAHPASANPHRVLDLQA